MTGTIAPIYARRLDAEARRYILKEAGDAAEARLRSFDCGDDYTLRYTVDLLADHLWRLPYFAEGTKFEAECLRSLRYIASEFEITPANLKVLSICISVVDDRYRDASGG